MNEKTIYQTIILKWK